MLHGTLVKIKDIDEDDFQTTPVEWETHAMGLPPVELPIEVEIVQVRTFKSQAEAIGVMQGLIGSKWNTKYPGTLGLFLHNKPNVRFAREVDFLRLTPTDKIEHRYIRNPLWRLKQGVYRHKVSTDAGMLVTPALQSQLYALLDIGHDKHWMQSFQLEDPQAKPLYKWQSDNSKRTDQLTHSPEQLLRLMHNILNYTKLPPIALEFKETGDACMFSVQTKKKGRDTDGGDGGEKPNFNWLHDIGQSEYEKLGDINTAPRVVFTGMKITMIMSWAMNARILIHELAHYFTFCIPTSYRLNKGEISLSFKQYQELFCGHGLLYMGVYARMLVKFYHVKEDWLLSSWDEAGLKYIAIDDLNLESVERAITGHYKAQSQD